MSYSINAGKMGLFAALLMTTALSSAGADKPAEKEVVPDAEGQRKYLEASRIEHNTVIDWKPLKTMTFDDAKALDGLKAVQGKWEVQDGQLVAVSGAAEDNRILLLSPMPDGPVRIEFDATLFPRADGRICDICIRFNADPETGSYVKSYALIAGQYFNQAAVFYKKNIPFARTEFAPLVPKKRHRIVAEWANKHFRFFVDDKVLIDAWDRDTPMPPDPTKWLGISTYDTRMVVDNLVISTAAPKPPAPK